MSEKVGMSALTAMLSVRSGDSREQTEGFLREMFDMISSVLAAGDTVKVPGIGMFKTIDVEARKSVNVNTGEETVIPAHRKVVFLPCKELAATVNAPFEMFQTMELTDELAAEFEVPAPAPEPEEVELPEQQAELQQAAKPEQPEEADHPELPCLSEQSVQTEQTEQSDQSDQSERSDQSDQVPASDTSGTVKRRFWPGFFTGFVAACVCALIVWGVMVVVELKRPDVKMTVTEVGPAPVDTKTDTISSGNGQASATAEHSEAQQVAQTTPEVPTQPSDQPVYDTISKTRYLTTMAKDHYGNFHLWPYIYKENEKILGHPDRIKPGTQVVIPDLAKYGVDPRNPKDIAKAKQMGLDIYARYR